MSNSSRWNHYSKGKYDFLTDFVVKNNVFFYCSKMSLILNLVFKNGFLGVITDISVELIWKVSEDSSIHDNINRYTYINIYIYI